MLPGTALQSSYAQSIEETLEERILKLMSEKEKSLIIELGRPSKNDENINSLVDQYWKTNELLNKMTYVEDVFKSANVVADIKSYATSQSSHNVGNFIYYSGAASGGEERTRIKAHLSSSNLILISGNNPICGDSDGTVYDKDRRGNIKLLDHLIHNNKYVPVHVIIDDYDIRPQLR